MENPTTFDLNRALRDWRASLTGSTSGSRENLDELEMHLRESVVRLRGAGLSEEEAWIIAQKRFGQSRAVGEELDKVHAPTRMRGISERQFIGTLLAAFVLLTGVFVYFDPPSDFLNWVEEFSDPNLWRHELYQRYHFALPSAHDCLVACAAVAAFLASVVLHLHFRDKRKKRLTS